MTQNKIDLALLAGYIIGTHDLKGEEKPPALLMPIIERALKASGETMPVPDKKQVEAKIDIDDTIKNIRNLKPSAEPVQTLDDEIDPPEPSEVGGGGNADDPENSEADDPDKTEKKTRKPWSEESRAKARERAIARGFGKKKSADQEDDEPGYRERPEPPAGDEIDEAIILTRDVHWSDIKRMRGNGLPLVRIAANQKVELQYLGKFITQMEEQDERGNA